MKRGLLVSLAMSTLLVSGLYAYGGKDCKSQSKSCGMKSQKSCNINKHAKGFGAKSVMRLIHKVNLTQEQMQKIQDIRQKTHKKINVIYNAFDADSFDKKKYLDITMNQKENMLKLQADTIEKIYNVLTSKQKSQLKVLMDLQEEKMKQGYAVDKHCNGRR